VTEGRGIYKRADLQRRRMPPRKTQPRVLIVCEGSETEPNYFRALIKHKGLSAVRVVGSDECGTTPCSIVDFAREEQKKATKDSRYAQIWCVFDRDEHPYIESARDRAYALHIDLAFSNPCFEVWFLLHFERSSKHRERDEVKKHLASRKFIPAYNKSMEVYHSLLESQDKACQHARWLREYHTKAGSSEFQNPSTTVDTLVDYLNSLAPKP
jgi:hypothetical protein